MVYHIGSARISEYGTINGKPGDQKGGGEVSIQRYYLHHKGWRVFRAKDPVKSKVIGLTMIDLCENDCFGYGQADRLTGFNAASKVGFDIKKVKTPVNIDCSVAIRICCMAAGIKREIFIQAMKLNASSQPISLQRIQIRSISKPGTAFSLVIF